MRARLGGRRREHLLEFGETRAFRDCAITLLPAGHILGSAQSFVESAAGTLLYTGDFKLRAGLSAEPAQWRHADTLIMETTFGLPKYVMPPTEEVLAPLPAEPRAHEPRGARVRDDFGMRGDMVAVRVRDEGERPRAVRIEPEVVGGEFEAAVVADGDHGSNGMGAARVRLRK